ncbi:unnamed protein product [Adineta steineri]|uniref:Uncharacterized protein n=1 Tax=Adineta steineri TaxID=433720 RepID=A0A814LRY4_9BILA|nr:unnamed protein product [Adineta steineri]CAF1070039.1 unnamed protein product [Adineta steineri]
MEELVEERNKLQEELNKPTKENNANDLLIEKINAWEKIIVERVQQTAEQVRQQAKQLINSKATKTTNEFRSFSEELTHLKETEDYAEHNLARLKQKIHQFNVYVTQLSQGTIIELNKEESERIQWNRIIYVQEKAAEVEVQQASTKIKESAQASKSLSQKKLRCGGLACTKCGKCSDWYRSDNKEPGYARRDGATCNYGYRDPHIRNRSYATRGNPDPATDHRGGDICYCK